VNINPSSATIALQKEKTMELAPPETLTAPAPITAIAPQQAGGMVKLKPEQLTELDDRVDDFVGDVMAMDVHSNGFKARLSA
jgi:hypothetical protein